MGDSTRRRRRAAAQSKARMPIEPHRVDAWVDVLGTLQVELLTTTRLSAEQVDQFIAEHLNHANGHQARARVADVTPPPCWRRGLRVENVAPCLGRSLGVVECHVQCGGS
jgi:hypothetical protein